MAASSIKGIQLWGILLTRECPTGNLKPKDRTEGSKLWGVNFERGEARVKKWLFSCPEGTEDFWFVLLVLSETEICFMGTELPEGLIAELSGLQKTAE